MFFGGAIFNALAFSGGNYLFSLFSDKGKTEMKRHNLTMEKITKDRDNYNKERQQRLDYINKTLRQQRHAEHTFTDLDAASQVYFEVTGQRLSPLKAPKKFSDYYNPSRQQKNSEFAFIIGGMTLLGVLAYKYM